METARELKSVNDLVREGLLSVSEGYLLRVHDKEERLLSTLTPRHRPYRLAALFISARAEAWTRRRETASLEQHIKALNGDIHAERQRTPQLQSDKEDARSREQRARINLESIKSSRSWRLLRMIGRLRSFIKGEARG
jgi:hypothetical protein